LYYILYDKCSVDSYLKDGIIDLSYKTNKPKRKPKPIKIPIEKPIKRDIPLLHKIILKQV